jgi:hypothetical protein
LVGHLIYCYLCVPFKFMHKYTRHIALLLLVVIIYPYIAQSLHVLGHDHGHMHVYGVAPGAHGNYSCTPDTGCVHHNNPANDRESTGIRGVTLTTRTDGGSDTPCTLCEHEFAKFSLTSIYTVVFGQDKIGVFGPVPYSEPSGIFTFNHISLRAPPLSS